MKCVLAGLGVAALCVLGCVRQEDIVRTRHAREWRCPEQQVKVYDLGGGVYKVYGCGPVATYKCIMSSQECILESTQTVAPQYPPPQYRPPQYGPPPQYPPPQYRPPPQSAPPPEATPPQQ